MRLAPALLALLLALGGGGCGSGAGDDASALTTGLERVDAAAVADDRQALASAVAGLLRAVDDAEAAGDLSASEAEEIRAAADALLDAADPSPPAGPSEPEESTTPPPPPPDNDEDGEEGPGKGKGKGEEHDEDEED